MTSEQCQSFLTAVESAGIKSYQFTTDTPSHLYNDGENHITKADFAKECIVAFRSATIGGSHNVYNGIQVVIADFADVHEIRTGGSYDQIKKFCESFNVELTDDEFKVLLKIDKQNYDIKPETGDYNKSFTYLSSKQYEALSNKEKAEYAERKAAYEKAKAEYIPANQAAQITLN